MLKKSASDEQEFKYMHGGKLNPDWVELLMGWPKGWSSLEPLDTEEFNEWEAGFSGEESVYGYAAWQDGSWENDTPRVVIETSENRVNRLKAIGNGQVPICAAAAWLLLNDYLVNYQIEMVNYPSTKRPSKDNPDQLSLLDIADL